MTCSGSYYAHRAAEGRFLDCQACGTAVLDTMLREVGEKWLCPECADEAKERDL